MPVEPNYISDELWCERCKYSDEESLNGCLRDGGPKLFGQSCWDAFRRLYGDSRLIRMTDEEGNLLSCFRVEFAEGEHE